MLRQALGYGWSVAVAALPDAGKPRLEHYVTCSDPDVGWIVRENLRRNRLRRLDAAWVDRCAQALGCGLFVESTVAGGWGSPVASVSQPDGC